MARKLMKGNEAIAEAAVRAGCRGFFGYPITPQNEIPEYMSRRMPEVGGAFVQAESEVAAINMVYGAAAACCRAMTSSSSPGISLKQEGLSYIAAADLPCLVVNMVRSGPGLGGIQPAQCDYFQAVKGGGHGDYHLIVLAPASIQEAVDMTYGAWDLAEKYRMPVLLLGDGMIGQMMEPVELPEMFDLSTLGVRDWELNGYDGKRKRVVYNTLRIEPDICEAYNIELFKRYDLLNANEQSAEEYLCEDAEIILTAYGTVSRICKSAITELRREGYKVGLLRPRTLYPFPKDIFKKYAEMPQVKSFLSVELSMGQMIEDVRLATECKKPVGFYGRCGGNVMTEEEIISAVKKAEV